LSGVRFCAKGHRSTFPAIPLRDKAPLHTTRDVSSRSQPIKFIFVINGFVPVTERPEMDSCGLVGDAGCPCKSFKANNIPS
jgi:hypothetical protein